MFKFFFILFIFILAITQSYFRPPGQRMDRSSKGNSFKMGKSQRCSNGKYFYILKSIMKRMIKQWWSTTTLISTQRTSTSPLESTATYADGSPCRGLGKARKMCRGIYDQTCVPVSAGFRTNEALC